jgi:N-methylhydantoinase A
MSSVMRPVDDFGDGELRTLALHLSERLGRGAPAGGRFTWIARARYRGQGHELEVPFEPEIAPTALGARFASIHQGRYGFALDLPVEIVSARCSQSGPTAAVTLARRGPSRWRDDDTADDGGEFEATVAGRTVLALRDATMLVAEGWSARALPIGGWLMERDG